MIKTEHKNIDGYEVKSTQLPAMRSLKVGARLLKVLGPALKHANTLAGVGADDDIEKLAPALMSLAENLDDETIDELFPALLASTSIVIENKSVDLGAAEKINTVFSGNLPLLFKVLAFALSVNFSGFFGEAAGAAAQNKGATEARK